MNSFPSNVNNPAILNPRTLSLLTAWIQNPIRQVSPRNIDLLQYERGHDVGTKTPCKKQSYTSWDSLSRSYVGSYSMSVVVGRDKRSTQRQQDPTDVQVPDTPTDAEVEAFGPTDLRAYQQGVKLFYRPVGLITKNQLKSTKILRAIRSQRGSSLSSDGTDESGDETNNTRVRRSLTDPAPSVVNPTPPAAPSPTVTVAQPSTSSTTKEPVIPLGTKWYADVYPVRCARVTQEPAEYESQTRIPYSAFYNSLLSKLSDPVAQGALGSLTKGPLIRDSVSLMLLVKYLAASNSTVMEVAPMLRLACIINSLDRSTYKTETIGYRIIRNWYQQEYVGAEIYSKTITSPKIIAMPLDTYIAFMSDRQPAPNADFTYLGADKDWVAVPAENSALRERWMLAYTLGFLSSELWNGTVNHVYTGKFEQARDGDALTTHMRVMPACSSVHIPGPTNVILVLVEYNQYAAIKSINTMGLNIPVYDGVTPIPSAALGPKITAWWKTNNINNILQDCLGAYSHTDKMLGVENASSIALSIAAEMYATQFNGIGIIPKKDSPSPDWTQSAHGAWVVDTGEGPATKDIPHTHIQAEVWYNVDDTDLLVKCRRRISGYNWSAVSTWCRPPTGIVRTQEVDSIYPGRGIFWSTDAPYNYSPVYTVTTLDSLKRISIYAKLVLTHEQTLTFQNSCGFAAYIHMLAAATAAQAAQIFIQTNLSLAVWTGYDTRRDEVSATARMDVAINTATAGITRYVDISNLISSWASWDEDIIYEYYSINPFNNPDWFSSHPLSLNLCIQWADKIQLHEGSYRQHTDFFYHNESNHQGYKLKDDSGIYRTYATATLDVEAYLPTVVYRDSGAGLIHMISWAEQWGRVSTLSSLSTTHPSSYVYMSQPLVLPMVDNGLEFSTDLIAYVVNSTMLQSDERFRIVSFSPVRWPDPINWQAILENAKRYIGEPALAAAIGGITGGLPGALIAGGGKLASNAIDHLTSGKTKDSAQRVLDTVVKEAKELYKDNPHTLNTHQTDPAFLDKTPVQLTPYQPAEVQDSSAEQLASTI